MPDRRDARGDADPDRTETQRRPVPEDATSASGTTVEADGGDPSEAEKNPYHGIHDDESGTT